MADNSEQIGQDEIEELLRQFKLACNDVQRHPVVAHVEEPCAHAGLAQLVGHSHHGRAARRAWLQGAAEVDEGDAHGFPLFTP